MSERKLLNSDILNRLQNTQLTSLPKEIVIDVQNMGQQDYEAILELVRQTPFGQKILARHVDTHPGNTDLTAIQKMRININAGQYSEALTVFRNESNPSSETILEAARAMIFLGRYDDCILHLDKLTQRKDLLASSRGTSLQLLGHALLEKGEIEHSEKCLIESKHFAEMIKNGHGSLSALLFLTKSKALLGEFDEMNKYLAEAFNIVKTQIRNPKWLMGFYRSKAFCSALSGNPRVHEDFMMCINLARLIDDQFYVAKSCLEWMLLLDSNSEIYIKLHEEAKTAMSLASKSYFESNLSLWVKATQTKRNDSDFPLSLSALINSKVQHPSHKQIIHFETLKKCAWSFDRELETIIDFNTFDLVTFNAEKPMGRMLTVVHDSQKPIDIQSCFEKAWELRWDQGRHINTVKVTISRLSKIIPSLKITRKDNCLSINSLGLVI